QGGLYGRNTSGGAINLQTRRPSLDQMDGYARAGYGRWHTYDFEAASTVQLGDSSALRIAGSRLFSNDAWQSSLVDRRPHGEKDIWNLRTWLLAELGDNTTVHWKLYGGANRSELNLGRAIGIYGVDQPYCAAVLSGRRDDDSCHTLAGVEAMANGQTPVMPSVQQRDGSTSLSQPINALDND